MSSASASAVYTARNYPFLDRIEELRTELPTWAYGEGLGLGRYPMPMYSNETNCGGCHIGGLPGQYGEALDDPYPGASTWTAKPGPPSFGGASGATCD